MKRVKLLVRGSAADWYDRNTRNPAFPLVWERLNAIREGRHVLHFNAADLALDYLILPDQTTIVLGFDRVRPGVVRLQYVEEL